MAELNITQILEAVNAIQDLPYGPDIMEGIGEIGLTNLNQGNVTALVAREFSAHLETLDADQRLPAVREFTDAISGLMDDATQAQVNQVLEAVEGMPPALQESVLDGVVGLVTSDEFGTPEYMENEFAADAAEVAQTAIADHLKTLPADQRFGALKEIQTATADLVEGPQADQFNGFMDSIGQAGPGIQQSFMHAYTNNPGFREYLATKAAEAPVPAAGEEPTNFMGPILDSLYMKHEGKIVSHDGKPVIDPNRAGPIQDILTNVGNDPEYDMRLVDNVIDATQTHADLIADHKKIFDVNKQDPRLAELNEKIADAQNNVIDTVRAAGGNVNAFAKLDGAMMMSFMEDLFDGGAGQAMNNLAHGLGLSGEQLDAFMTQFGPLAEMMEYMFEPYAELYKEYAPAARASIERAVERADTLTGGGRDVSFQATADGEISTDISREQFISAFKEAMDGKSLTEENILAAAKEADPEFKDEAVLITTSTQLSAAFTRAVDMTDLDTAANSLAGIRQTVAEIDDPNVSGLSEVRQAMGMAPV